jgi:hypothetical protein
MASLKDFITSFDMSDDPKSTPEIDAFDEAIEVSDRGTVHIQVNHDFVNDSTIIIPTFSIDGVNFAPLEKNGETIQVALSANPSGLIITDLVPGTRMKIGMLYGGQSTGTLTIKVAT